MTAASGLRRPTSATNDGAPGAVPDALLSVDRLLVRYGPIEAVRGVSLNVKQGEIVALLGANGAGKSSTLGAIVGLVPVAGGSVRFEGREIAGAATETIVRRGIALVPEGRHLFRNMSVYENLRLGAATRGRAGFEEQLPDILGTFPVVRQRLHAIAGFLSGGEQQQVAIARALLSRPRLLLLDEPSLGLAPIIVARVFDTIQSLRATGVTILLVEQNVERALAIADRAYVLASGSVELAGAAQSIAGAAIEQAYLGIGTAARA